MYQVDHNKLQLSHSNPDGNILLERSYSWWTWFCVCIYYSPCAIHVHVLFFIHCSLIFPFDPLHLVMISYMIVKFIHVS